MMCNLGRKDRILRLSLGVLFGGLGIYTVGNAGIVMGVVGLILLLTGLVGFCPAYTLFKINTCQTKNH